MAANDTVAIFLPTDNEPPATNYATFGVRPTTLHPHLAFDGASATEAAIFTGIMPRNYGGGGLAVYLHVACTSATSGSSRWEAYFERMDVGTLDLDGNSFASAQSGGASASGTCGVMSLVTISFTNAQIDGITAGDMYRLKIERDYDGTTGTDDITTDVELYGVEIKET